MVASVNNFFSPGEKVLVINGGKFGERWVKIAQAYGLNVIEIPVEWGFSIDVNRVEEELRKHPDIKGVFIQASETSTGVYHDVEAVGKIVKNYEDTLFIVDSISALVAHDIKTDEWGIDVMVSGSQKGFMLPPGLAFVSVSEKAWKRNEKSKMPRFYFNLKKRKRESCQESNQLYICRISYYRTQRGTETHAKRRT